MKKEQKKKKTWTLEELTPEERKELQELVRTHPEVDSTAIALMIRARQINKNPHLPHECGDDDEMPEVLVDWHRKHPKEPYGSEKEIEVLKDEIKRLNNEE